ncbi:MAG: RluA family pseudouridine synthase [Fervidobacterium sp.]
MTEKNEKSKNVFEWIVDEKNYFSRVDKFLRKILKNVPLSAIYKFFRTGRIYLNGKKIKDPATKLELGDIVQIVDEDLNMYNRKYKEMKPTKMKLDIIYEDDIIIALNKPAGIPVHPGKNVNKPSLIEGLKYYGEKNSFEPFLVHRLDKDTSGVLIVAKDRNVARELSEIISLKDVLKVYTALVFGKQKDLVIEQHIDNKEAKSILRVQKYYRTIMNNEEIYLTLIEVSIETGRKHQIRKHLAYVETPIVCDNDYGDFRLNRLFTKKYELKRQFLHCTRMAFNYSGKYYELNAPLSPDLQNTLKLLELESGRR